MIRLAGARLLFLLALLAALAPAFAGGCTPVRMMAEYDEETDRAVTEVQRQVEWLLTRIERHAGSPEGDYAQFEDAYDALSVELSALALRAGARPQNELQVEQLELLRQSLANLEALHRLGISREQVPPLRNAFNSSFRAILTLELARRRGT